MKYLVHFYILMALSISMPSLAADSYVVSGVGASSCGKWLEGRALKSKNLDSVFTSWLQGFMSGMNTQRYVQSKQKMSLLPDAPTLLAYVDKECRDKPLEDVYSIAIQLYQDIQKK